MAAQARLLNSRVICLSDKYTGTKSFMEYLGGLGAIVAQKDLVNALGVEDRLDSPTIRLMGEVKRNSADAQKATELGRALVQSGVADTLFTKIATLDDKDPNNALFVDSLAQLQQPIVNFHRECLDGKKEFEKILPKVLGSIASGNVDMEMISAAMLQDHNSFESFKKIYFALAKAKKKDELEKFFQERYQEYLKNDDSSEALRRFLLSMNDARRLKLIGPKADVNVLKSSTREAFDGAEPDRVIACCRRLIARNAHLEYAYNMLGVTYRKLGKLDDAIKAYERGIELEPESIKLYHNVAIAYSIKGDLVKARSAATKERSLRGLKPEE